MNLSEWITNQTDLVLELNLSWLNDPVAAVGKNISE